MLALLSLLQARRDWPGTELARRLGVSERTVRRDVDRLRGMGYRVEAAKGPAGGYRLDAGGALPPLLFDDEQAVALGVALAQSAIAGPDLRDAAARARATLRQVLPGHLRERLDALTAAVDQAVPETATRVDPAVLHGAAAAVDGRRTLRIAYGFRDEPRRIEPHRLVLRDGRWYLVAWDLGPAGWRLLRVDRVRILGGAGRPFRPRRIPGGDALRFVESRMRGGGYDGRWPCIGSVELLLPASEVEPFAGDGTVERLDDDRCRVTLGAWSWPALAARFATFDATFVSPRPRALTEACQILAARLASAAAR